MTKPTKPRKSGRCVSFEAAEKVAQRIQRTLKSPSWLLGLGIRKGWRFEMTTHEDFAEIQFDDDGLRLVHRVATHVLKLLAELDGAPFNLILARIPPGGHDDVRAIREIVRSHAERNERRVKNHKKREGIQLTADQKRQLASFQYHVVQLLGAVSDMEMGMMLDRFPDNVRDDISKLRDIIRGQLDGWDEHRQIGAFTLRDGAVAAVVSVGVSADRAFVRVGSQAPTWLHVDDAARLVEALRKTHCGGMERSGPKPEAN